MNKGVAGFLWLFAEKFGGIFFSTVTFLAYSFFLTPGEFGYAALATSISLIFSQTIVVALQDALVCANRVSKRLISSCLWFNLFLSVLCTVIIVLGSELYVSSQELKILTQLASVIVVISGLSTIYKAILRRHKKFKKLALNQFIGRFFGCLAGIGFATAGFGATAVVLQLICIELFAFLTIVAGFKLKLRLVFCWSGVCSLLTNGIPIALKKVSWEAFARGIPIALGLVTTPALVGYFAFAWRIVDMPRAAIHSAALSFVLPHFSADRKCEDSIKRSYIFSTKLMCIFTTPFFLFLALYSEPLLKLIFDSKWNDAAPLVSMLCIVPLLANLRIFAPSLFTSINRSRLGTKTEIASTIVALLACIVVSPKLGAAAGVFAFVTRVVLNIPVTAIYLKRLISLGFGSYFKIFSSTVVPLLIVTAIHFSGLYEPSGSLIFLQIFMELVLYLVIFWILETDRVELITQLRGRT